MSEPLKQSLSKSLDQSANQSASRSVTRSTRQSLDDDASPRRELLVLVIGEHMGGFSVLLEFLTKRGCRCIFAGSRKEARKLLKAGHFQFVLDASSQPGDEELSGEIAGSNCTIFRCCRVENSSLWLPVFRNGEKCFGSPALRPREFAQKLEDLSCGCESCRDGRVNGSERWPIC